MLGTPALEARRRLPPQRLAPSPLTEPGASPFLSPTATPYAAVSTSPDAFQEACRLLKRGVCWEEQNAGADHRRRRPCDRV